MTAITVTFTDKVATRLDPDSPITTGLMNDLWDNTTFVKEWLGESFKAAAVQDHNHDGINSALLEVGNNRIRNASFEEGTAATGWTVTDFSGGSHVVESANDIHGAQTLAFSSTVLANGGGDALSNEFMPIAELESYQWRVFVKASVVNVSSKAELVWYDDAQSEISATQLYQNTSTPTAAALKRGTLTPPTNARFTRLRVTGGVPAVGTATGTIYFDGVSFNNFVAVVRARLKTNTTSLAGTLLDTSKLLITMNPYAFFPMMHATEDAFNDNFLSVHTTDGASPDNPRLSFVRTAASGNKTYDFDYRWVAAS